MTATLLELPPAWPDAPDAPEDLPEMTDESQDDPPIELLFANMNVSRRQLAAGTLPGYADLLLDDLDGIHDGGLELTPTRAIITGLMLRWSHRHLLWNDDGQPSIVGALHETWARNFRDTILSGEPLGKQAFNAAAYAAMPPKDHSLYALGFLNRYMGGVRAVVFGDYDIKDGPVNYDDFGLGDCHIQMTPEAYRHFGAEFGTGIAGDSRFGLRVLQRSIGKRGVGGVILDTHHIQRAHDGDADFRLSPDEILQDMGGIGLPLGGVHLAAGRLDAVHKDDAERSMNDLAAWLKGPEAMLSDSRLGELLASCLSLWRRDHAHQPDGVPPMPVTIEVPSAALAAFYERKNKNLKMDHDRFVDAHRTLAEHALQLAVML